MSKKAVISAKIIFDAIEAVEESICQFDTDDTMGKADYLNRLDELKTQVQDLCPADIDNFRAPFAR